MPGRNRWLPLLWISALMVLLQVIGPEYFRYDARLIEQGQLWRWLTAHLVHANWIHLALNLAGFALCVGITGVSWTIGQWLWRIVLLSAAISTGFYLWQPAMGWYVGFSGVLFGLYLLAAYATFKQQATISALLALFIIGKIAMEQFSSVNMTTEDLIGVPVMVDAHLYGVSVAILIIAAQIVYFYFIEQDRNST